MQRLFSTLRSFRVFPASVARQVALAAVTGFAALCQLAGAQGFSAYVTPSRLEADVKPGEKRRLIVDIHHVGRSPGRYGITTNDWRFLPDHTVDFSAKLTENSCRPWVAIESRELVLTADEKYRFRVEVSPPVGTSPRECRFALMIEGAEPAQVGGGALTVPVSGRIGVIFYIRVGLVEPDLSVTGHRVEKRQGVLLPVIELRNAGLATGRPEGFLRAVDETGGTDLVFEDVPILPGARRWVALRPARVDDAQTTGPPLRFPLTVKGTLEWGKRQEALELRFVP